MYIGAKDVSNVVGNDENREAMEDVEMN